MKIMIMSDSAPPQMGGAESYVIQLGTNLTKLGHEVHWLTAKIPNTQEDEIYQGIKIHRVPIFFAKKFVFPGRQTFAITSSMSKLPFVRDIDVIQADTLVAGVSGWYVAKRARKPSLLYCFEFLGDLWKKTGQSMLERRIYPMVERRIATSPYDWYACPSEYSKQTLIKAGAPADKISVIHLGVNHSIFNSNMNGEGFRKKFNLQDNKIFGFAGRLRVKKTGQTKNLMALLQATKRVVELLPSAKLVLKGDGYEEIAPIIEKMGISKNVVYVGNFPYEDNPKFLRMCDVVVCPALADGFCFLLAEASACGVPMVATNLGAHVERVIDGKTGLLAKPDAKSIADCILQILSDDNLAKKYGKEAEIYAKNFTWERTTREHLQLYQRLIESKSYQIA